MEWTQNSPWNLFSRLPFSIEYDLDMSTVAAMLRDVATVPFGLGGEASDGRAVADSSTFSTGRLFKRCILKAEKTNLSWCKNGLPRQAGILKYQINHSDEIL